jgi:phosphoribosylamine-glycine ligase
MQEPFTLKHLVLITFSFEGAAVALHAQDEGVETIVGVIFDQAQPETSLEHAHATEEPDAKKEQRLITYGGMLDKRPVQEVYELLEQIPEEEKHEWFVFCDFNHCWRWAEKIAPLGIPGNYPTEEDRNFEIDRNAMKEFVDKHYELDHQEVMEFSEIDAAKEFLENEERIWVLKGKGDKVSTKVPDTSDPDLAKQQIISELEDNKSDLENEGFILEEMIIDAVEITPQKIYYNGVPVFTDLDIEIKGLANDSGPMTGCTGDLVFPTDMKAKINKLAFPAVIDEMAKKHQGIFIWDLSMYFDTNTGKVYPGEFCPNRFGYSAFYNELAQVGSVVKFFEEVVNGRNPFAEDPSLFGASVRLFNIPKQSDDGYRLKEAALIHSDKVKPHVWPMYVRRAGQQMVTVKYEWDIAVVTGQGDTPRKAVYRAYKNADQVVFPDLYQLPIESFLSERYAESVLNRYNYLIENKWI